MIGQFTNAAGVNWLSEVMRLRELEEENLALRRSMICALNQLLDLKDLNTGVHLSLIHI